MNLDMLKQMQTGKGFIAALDQSGGSTPKALENYGISPSEYSNDDEMFELMHQMRSRIVKSPVFTSEHVIGAILFEKTMLSKIDGKFTAEYLWQNKHIVPFLKVDKGLLDEENNVRLMKPLEESLVIELPEAKAHGVFGTKMRSFILDYNEQGIHDIIAQQFHYAKIICDAGLVPILEPEVYIDDPEKARIEDRMKFEIEEQLAAWQPADKIMFKFSIPSVPNLYEDLYDYDAVVRIVALSGGYSLDEACERLSKNHNMPASFSRALLQNLRAQQTDAEFDKALGEAISQIYQASIQ